MVMSPLAEAADFVHATVMLSGFERADGSQVFPKLTLAGAVLMTPHAWSEPCVASMSLLMLCGRISLTRMLSFFPPIPCEPRLWFQRFDCSDEPLNLCEPSASRW